MNIDIKSEVKAAIKELAAEGDDVKALKDVVRTVVREEISRAGGQDSSNDLKGLLKEAVGEVLIETAEKQKEGLLRLLNVA